MSNLELYNKYKEPPKEALKEIKGGRMNGKLDISPMWRIKCLTEEFGPCGVGWYYTETNRQFVNGADCEIAVFVDIDLFYRVGDGWSMPVHGSGGSMFIASEKEGFHTSDEVIKMATTDALSVCCKQLGIASDVYMGLMDSKYERAGERKTPSSGFASPSQVSYYKTLTNGITPRMMKPPEEMTKDEISAEIDFYKTGKQR